MHEMLASKGCLNHLAAEAKAPPGAIIQLQEVYEFLSGDKVIIAPRHRTADYSAAVGTIFKPADGGYSAEKPFANAETISIIDQQSAILKFNNYGPVIVEGIDTRIMPRGKWRSFLLLKCVGTRSVPAAIGQQELLVLQAVSRDGFPGDVVIW